MATTDQVMVQTNCAVDDKWVLLENKITINIFCNLTLITNIREIEHGCQIYTAAGSKTTKLIGYNSLVWFNYDGIISILLLNNVRQYLLVTYDS